ncbi:DUF3006 domain-containing protein [Tissierella praeacuta]|uniref:DUF3006 domain-containing protein n=1 Tax=Tissierella praeacuta TaxID=43131 RepID=UPI003341438F
MRFTIDRFEGELAIVELENKEIIEIPKAILPLDAKEGDIIATSVDIGETEERKRRIQEKFESLFCEDD